MVEEIFLILKYLKVFVSFIIWWKLKKKLIIEIIKKIFWSMNLYLLLLILNFVLRIYINCLRYKLLWLVRYLKLRN